MHTYSQKFVFYLYRMPYVYVLLLLPFSSSLVVAVVCFYLHPKKQLIVIEKEIEQRLQIGKRQLNNNICTIKIVHVHGTSVLLSTTYKFVLYYTFYGGTEIKDTDTESVI